jgi:hypothetical protein
LTILVPIVMFGWIPFSIYMFKTKEPQTALLIVVVGGFLLLPVYSFEFSGLPAYDKFTAIAISAIAGEFFSGRFRTHPFVFEKADIPIVVFTFFSPIATALSNGLGLYTGIAGLYINFMQWWVFYWAGRRYFKDSASMRKLTLMMVIGGLVYFPFMMIEVRLSPQLHRIVYGFHPHSFLQQMRNGGFRPTVFLSHGLVVAQWAVFSAISAYWLWKSRAVPKLKKVSMLILALMMAGAAVLCKSSAPIVFMLVGFGVATLSRASRSARIIEIMLLIPYLYFVLRISNILPISLLQAEMEKYFNPDRVASALMRFRQEDLFGARAALRPILGWAGYQRGWPRDPRTGQLAIAMVDSVWIIQYSTNGLVGLLSSFLSMGIGAWMVVREYLKSKSSRLKGAFGIPIDGLVISLLLSIFILDCLFNGGGNPVPLVFAGALVSYAKSLRDMRGSAATPSPANGSV